MKSLPPDYVLTMFERRFTREASVSLHRQVYDLVRQPIIDGELPAGTRLPPGRVLSQRLRLSRHTVSSAIEQLSGEGYLVGRVGSGTFVSHHFAAERVDTARPPSQSTAMELSARGRLLAAMQRSPFRWDDPTAPANNPPPFRVGLPAIDAFPTKEWSRALSHAWNSSATHLGYQGPRGHFPLRSAISDYLYASRGLRCDADQIVITAGSQNGLDLTFRLLVDPGDTVAVEDPGYIGARSAAIAAGARVVGVAVDGKGLVTEDLARQQVTPRVVFVTPTHQFPTGAPMAVDRRLELIEWARANRAWIIEDDYGSEFRYAGRPCDPLSVLDREGCVIYAGTFAKVMFPALRLGYLVLPAGLVDSFEAAHVSTDIHRPHLEQVALSAFMHDGRFARHLRRTGELHAERRQRLLESLSAQLGGLLVVEQAESGLHMLTRLVTGSNDFALSSAAAAKGLDPWPLSIHYQTTPQPGMLLGFGGSTPAVIEQAVQTLAGVLDSQAS
ncbi:PLP-dependent aminotransferase family protein [Rhodococcus opacus]|uniref:PLP-dependent aminotransferase family protein n=1 Tax=Rhodococcus opacus TaxID=37919 RepID=A0A2S8IHH9_RHOOP|nr:PLP-dependent aminotransferase family protein [Rhodococcus opacus]PQP14220.1 PLP-dependent aminotransferase family protein [Rhodococcus opacus]